MTPQERDIIGRFIERVSGAPAPAGGSSVPATTQPGALPAIDPEADRFIGEQFANYPNARYRITQMAFVQEAALAEAQNRIKRLEYDLQNAQQAQAQAPQQGRGLFGGLFGGGGAARPAYQQTQYAPPPQASYPPGYQPGMFQSGGGSGFLGSALTTAAGVAGGVLAADAISSMFSPHGYGMGGGFGGGGFGGGMGGGGWGGGEVINETTVNNYGTDGGAVGGSGGDPWAGGGTSDAGSWDQGASEPDAGGGGDSWGGSGDAGGGGDAGWDDSGGSDNSF
jgi:hypothetical protein